jgi:hypothetical protein
VAVVVVIACAWAALVVGEMVCARRRTNARIPRGIVRRISKPGTRHVVRLRGLMAGVAGTWNPAKPWGPRNWLYGPGEGTYWMGEDASVHLDWRPRRGEAQHLVGPVPESAGPNALGHRRIRRIRRVVLTLYAVCAIGGFAWGYAASSGAASHRVAIVTFGAFMAYVVAYFVMLTALAIARRRLRTGTHLNAE